MQPLSKSEKEKILSRMFWDMEKSDAQLHKLLDGEANEVEQQSFYRRLLISCDWYTLLKLMPLPKIKTILNSPVIDHIYPRELKHRFAYARNVLSRQRVSASE